MKRITLEKEKNLKMSKFKVGMEAAASKTFNGKDVKLFSEISGDINPLHLDEDYASKSIFGKRIIHGFLYSSLISAVIANQLPGPGSIYLNQELNFTKPVFWGDTVTAKVKIIEIRKEKQVLILETTCFKENDKIVVSGQAVVKLV